MFKGNTFIDDLTIKDFELFDDGIKQKIEAVYLIKKERVERSEEKKKFRPQTARSFFLFFEVNEYSRRLQEAMKYFMEEIFLPEDNLIIITPMKTYRLKDESKKNKTKQEIFEEMKGLLRPDALAGTADFRHIVSDIEQLSKEMLSLLQIAQGIQDPGAYDFRDASLKLVEYEGLMSRLQIFRQADELRFLDFANYLKTQDRQNYVFIFYERKLIPQIDSRLLRDFIYSFEGDSYIVQSLSSVLDYNKRETYLDVKKITQAFSDTSTSVHFLHISTPIISIPGLRFEEYAQETFNIIMEIARATGGYAESSANPAVLFKNALYASENYYLIYYSPKNYVGDGEFKSIKVQLKNKDYKV
ncbi:MAG: hypothetical protein KAX11_10375, partial [Candidatus Aminicenantes bacterium]|nr:hypothetical protein [Candidatus Aminicenantes bacterium]